MVLRKGFDEERDQGDEAKVTVQQVYGPQSSSDQSQVGLHGFLVW